MTHALFYLFSFACFNIFWIRDTMGIASHSMVDRIMVVFADQTKGLSVRGKI